jgi:hypothetical protein
MMKVLSIVFSVCVLSSICFGQGDFLKRSRGQSSVGLGVKSNMAAVKKVQLIGEKNYFLTDLGATEIYSEDYYDYNPSAKQVLDGQVYYHENGSQEVSSHLKDVLIYENDTHLVRLERYALGANETFKLRLVEDYFYGSENLLEKIEVATNNFGEPMFVTNEEFLEYNLEGRLIYKEVKSRTDSLAEFRTSSKYYTDYNSAGRVSETRMFYCDNASSCYLGDKRTYSYNAFGKVIEHTIEMYSRNGDISSHYVDSYEYDGSGEKVLRMHGIEYNTESHKFVPSSDFELYYAENGSALDSAVVFLYGYNDSTIIDKLLFDEFDYNLNVSQEDILFPSDYFSDIEPGNEMFFGNQLNSFRRRAWINTDNNYETGEYFEFNYSNFTSVSEPTVFDFTLSPNPASDVIKVGLTDNNTQRIEVYNINGVLMHAEDVSEVELTVNIQVFERGTYVVKAIGENGFRTKQFVKL